MSHSDFVRHTRCGQLLQRRVDASSFPPIYWFTTPGGADALARCPDCGLAMHFAVTQNEIEQEPQHAATH